MYVIVLNISGFLCIVDYIRGTLFVYIECNVEGGERRNSGLSLIYMDKLQHSGYLFLRQ